MRIIEFIACKHLITMKNTSSLNTLIFNSINLHHEISYKRSVEMIYFLRSFFPPYVTSPEKCGKEYFSMVLGRKKATTQLLANIRTILSLTTLSGRKYIGRGLSLWPYAYLLQRRAKGKENGFLNFWAGGHMSKRTSPVERLNGRKFTATNWKKANGGGKA